MYVTKWKLGAAPAAVFLAGLGFAGPGAAHPDHKTEKVIIFTDRHDGPAAKGAAPRIRTFHLDGRRAVECDGERSEVSESSKDSEGGREKTRIVICGGDRSSAEHREQLERALSRIQSNERLSQEHREKVTAALREAIDRIRAER